MVPCTTTTTTTNSRQSFFFFLSFESASHRSSAYFCNQLYVTGNRKRCAVFNCFSQWSRRIVFSSLLCVCVCEHKEKNDTHSVCFVCRRETLETNIRLVLFFVVFLYSRWSRRRLWCEIKDDKTCAATSCLRIFNVGDTQ